VPDSEKRPMDAPTYRLEAFAWWEVTPDVCDRCRRSFALRGAETVAVLCHDDENGDPRADVVFCRWCAHDAAPLACNVRPAGAS
jgi:hypothetical protein